MQIGAAWVQKITPSPKKSAMSLPKKSGGSLKKSAMSLPKKSGGSFKKSAMSLQKIRGGRLKNQQKISKKSAKKSTSDRPKSEIENLGESMQMSEHRNSRVFAKCVKKTWSFRCDVVDQMLLSKNQQKISQTPKCCFQKISKKSAKPQMLLSKNQQKISKKITQPQMSLPVVQRRSATPICLRTCSESLFASGYT